MILEFDPLIHTFSRIRTGSRTRHTEISAYTPIWSTKGVCIAKGSWELSGWVCSSRRFLNSEGKSGGVSTQRIWDVSG